MKEYLIHKDTFFCTKSNSLKHVVGNETNEIILDNLESKILLYFVKRAGEVVSKDELMEIWNAQYVMEHSLTRVISTLRKKLENLNDLASLIKTIPREGYQFNGSAIIDNAIEPDKTDQKADTQVIALPSKSINKMLVFSVLGLIILLIVISLKSSKDVQLIPDLKPYVYEIVDNSVLKEDVSMNPDGETLVYSSKLLTGNWSLKIVSSNSQFSREYAEQGYDLIAPTWLDNEELVFVMSNSEHCSIRKINIYKTPENNVGTPISSCNVTNPSRGLSVLDANTLLVSDSDDISLPKQLITIDINTGRKVVVHNKSLEGSGAYRVFTSPNKKFIATLSSKNWFDTDIQVYKADNPTTVYWQKTVDYPLFSIAFGDNSLVFKDEVGRFRIISYLSSSEQSEISIPLVITRPVYSPSYAKNGFLFTEGDKFSHKIVRTNFENGEQKVLSQIDGVSSGTPVLIDGDNVMLYSSNQTGINQIWKKNLKSAKYEQISNFKLSYFIEKIVVNDSETEIAIETNKGIILGVFDITGKIIEQQFLKGDLPSFWQGNLLYTLKNKGESVVYQYHKESKQSIVLITNGAYKTVIDQGNLFYSKYHVSGIWQYNASAEDKLIHHEPSAYIGEDWDVFDNYLYIRNPNDSISKVAVIENNDKLDTALHNLCRRINIVANDVCLSSKGESSVNRLLRYNYN